jgi:hypothetical protein
MSSAGVCRFRQGATSRDMEAAVALDSLSKRPCNIKLCDLVRLNAYQGNEAKAADAASARRPFNLDRVLVSSIGVTSILHSPQAHPRRRIDRQRERTPVNSRASPIETTDDIRRGHNGTGQKQLEMFRSY